MSDFRIDAEGAWHYRGREMVRRDIVDLFYRHLRRDATGNFFIEIGRQRRLVDVEDTAYVVWAICRTGSEGSPDECIRLLLSDDSSEELDPATLRIGGRNIPYCRVKNGGFDARFSRPCYYQLAEHIQQNPASDGYNLSLRGIHFILKEEKGE